MKLSVVIPTNRHAKYVRPLLKSICGQTLDGGYEVLLVANSHDPGLQALVQSLRGPFYYLCTNQRGVNRARNLGLQEAKGDFVLFLDDDAVLVREDFFMRHLRWHHYFSKPMGIGGPYQLPDRASRVARAYHAVSSTWLENNRQKGGFSLRLLGGNCSFPTQLLRQCGGFDENLQFGGTETELQLRLLPLGCRFYLDENLVVEHRVRINISGLIYKGFQQGYTSAQLSALYANKLKVRNKPSDPHFYFRIYNLAFHAGKWSMQRGAERRHWFSEILKFVVRRWLRNLINWRYSSFVNELFFAAKHAKRPVEPSTSK